MSNRNGEVFLDRLFRASTQVELPRNVVVTVRALGDLELKQRDSLALKASVKLQKALDDKESEEYADFILPLNDLDDERLKNSLVSFYQTLEAVPESLSSAKNRYVDVPDEPTPDERRSAEIEQQSEDDAALKMRSQIVQELTDSYQKSIADWPHEKLLAEAKAQAVRFFCYGEEMTQRVYTSLYFATEQNGKRYFQSLDDFKNLNPEIINKLHKAFVDVNELDVWHLEKAALSGESRPSAN